MEGHNTPEIKDNKMFTTELNMYVTVTKEAKLETIKTGTGLKCKVNFSGLYAGTDCGFSVYNGLALDFMANVQVGDVVTINATMHSYSGQLKDFHGELLLKDGAPIKTTKYVLIVSAWELLFKRKELVCTSVAPN